MKLFKESKHQFSHMSDPRIQLMFHLEIPTSLPSNMLSMRKRQKALSPHPQAVLSHMWKDGNHKNSVQDSHTYTHDQISSHVLVNKQLRLKQQVLDFHGGNIPTTADFKIP